MINFFNNLQRSREYRIFISVITACVCAIICSFMVSIGGSIEIAGYGFGAVSAVMVWCAMLNYLGSQQ